MAGLLHEHGHLSVSLRIQVWCVVAHTCDRGAGETETGGSLGVHSTASLLINEPQVPVRDLF